MNLKEVRQQFVKMTGRRDLVKASDKDNGADWFIQMGQKLLDGLQETRDIEVTKTLAIDEYLIELIDCVAVKGVWLETTDGLSPALDKQTFTWLAENYDAIPPEDSGMPLYWSPVVDVRNNLTKRIVVIPATDEEITVIIHGKFRSKELKEDADISFWSHYHPDTLVQAAAWKMQSFYGNRSGMLTAMEAIQEDLLGIDRDIVAEECEPIPRFKE